MKYELKYPDMTHIHDERNGVIRSKHKNLCYWCKNDTEYVDINYEAPICSEECLKDFEISIFVRDT